MANQRIDQLNAETTPAAADVLPVYSIAGSDTKKITVKDLVQQGAALVDDASIPVAKVNLSGISGTNITAGTVAASKLDTSTIPATGGVTVSSSNLQLVAPTTPIVRNAGTGSLEHAVSGATAGTYTKVTVDSKGHVTAGANLVGADVPVATSSVVGGVSIPAAGGLALTGGGALSHSNAVAGGASTRSGITYDLQGHITSTVALVASDLPIATGAALGAVIAGTGLAVDGNGILSSGVATTSNLGGIKIGSEFGLNGSNQLLLAVQANVAGGTAYPKVTVNSKGVVTAGATLDATDIPNLATTKITSGTLGIDRYGANTITGAKLANYATGKISEAFPTADYISQLYFNPLDRTLYMWDGNVYQPIGVSYGQVVFSGTYDAGTNLITSVTTEGAAIGLTVGGALTAPVTANKSHYVVVDQPGTGTAPAPAVALSPPDMLLSNGTTWILLDVSDTVTAQLASNVQVSPAGNIASTNVQSALQELDDEKLAKAGGTLTGNLALNTGIAIVYEGATTNDFETTLYVVDPTADRTILLPNVSGTVVTTGDTGTVTSTMLLDGTILNEDINASAAIVDTKLATIATALKVSNSATTAASANTASAIVARDASGNFTAGTITAALTGAASSNVLKAGDTMTGALVVPLASASTPSLTFTGDLNTGIYSPGADQVAVATNGTSRLSIDASGNVAVDTNTLYVDAVNNRLAIGTTSPNTALSIDGNSPFGAFGSGAPIITLKNTDTTTFNSSQIVNRDSSGNINAGISFVNGSHGASGSSYMNFAVRNAGTLLENAISISNAGTTTLTSAATTAPFIAKISTSEVARIDSSGRLLVGTSTSVTGASIEANSSSTVFRFANPSEFGWWRANGSAGSPTVVADGNTLGRIYAVGYDGTNYINAARIEAAVDGTPGTNDMPGRLVFSTTADGASSPTERMRINSAGALGVGGANFGTTGQALISNGSSAVPTWQDLNTAVFGWDHDNDTYGLYLPGTSISTGSLSGTINIDVQSRIRRCVINNSGVVQYYLDADASTNKAGDWLRIVETESLATAYTGAPAAEATNSLLRVGVPAWAAGTFTRGQRVTNGGYLWECIAASSTATPAAGAVASVLDGTDGQVVVEIPAFSVRYGFINGVHTREVRLGCNDGLIAQGFRPHPAFIKTDGTYKSAFYWGAYQAYSDGTNLASVSGQTNTRSLTRATFRTRAALRGTGWHVQSYLELAAIQTLLVTEYRDYNSQKVLGNGSIEGSTYGVATGLSNSRGNRSGNVYTGGGSSSDFMSYRGIENLYGRAWTWADGINVYERVVYLTNNQSVFADDTSVGYSFYAQVPSSSGSYQKELFPLADVFLPSVVGASSTTYLADALYTSTGWRVAFVGGVSGIGSLGGAFYLNLGSGSGIALDSRGARSAYAAN